MKIKLNRIALGLLAGLVMLIASPAQAQQNYLVQTSLSAAVAAPAAQAIAAPVPYSFVTVASATGITGILLNQSSTINQQNQWEIYVDRELMAVVAVNGTTLQVQRGVGGTVAAAHASGSMVLAGRNYWFNVADPGVPSTQGSGTPSNQPCVLANVVASPWLNIRTGYQWYCNPNTLVWTPGFNNPFLQTGDYFSSSAAAAATAILGPVVKITGATGITSFTFSATLGAIGLAPAALTTANSLNGQFCTIGGTWATSIGNNIGTVVTSTAGEKICWQYSGTDHVWYALP